MSVGDDREKNAMALMTDEIAKTLLPRDMDVREKGQHRLGHTSEAPTMIKYKAGFINEEIAGTYFWSVADGSGSVASMPAAKRAITRHLNNNDDATILRKAAALLIKRAEQRDFLESPDAVKDLFQTKLKLQEREVFACALLDNRHRLISYQELFYGTIDSASVYPREVVKAALYANAAAVIFCHNHPSGVAEPSRADLDITKKLTSALKLIDIRVLDHIIVGDGYSVSLAERGEM